MKDRMEALQADYANQLKNMQNWVINMERAQTSLKNFPPKGNWVQKKAPQDKRPPNQLDPINMLRKSFPTADLVRPFMKSPPVT